MKNNHNRGIVCVWVGGEMWKVALMGRWANDQWLTLSSGIEDG